MNSLKYAYSQLSCEQPVEAQNLLEVGGMVQRMKTVNSVQPRMSKDVDGVVIFQPVSIVRRAKVFPLQIGWCRTNIHAMQRY